MKQWWFIMVMLFYVSSCAGYPLPEATPNAAAGSTQGKVVDPKPETTASPEASRMGLTWGKVSHDNQLEVDLVGCYGRPRIGGTTDGPACNPYQGDTSCSVALPVLCLKINDLARPNYAIEGSGGAMPPEYYRGWASGQIGLTEPIRGTDLSSLERSNEICQASLGEGYRMAEFHDGKYVSGMGKDRYYADTWPAPDRLMSGGWNWYAYGVIRDDTRFWVHINDQPANCWDGTIASSASVPSPTPTAASIKFRGEISRGQIVEKEIWNGLMFRLDPLEQGWEIWLGDQSGTDHNFSGVVTPPFHGINSRYIEGWHFRNSDNSGPNDVGEKNVNAPQDERGFCFLLNETDYQIAYLRLNDQLLSSEEERQEIREKYELAKAEERNTADN